MQTKEKIRLQLKQQAKQFSPTYFILEDRASVDALLECPSYRRCSTLFGFSPLASEVDITVVLEEAINHKKLALPRCIGDTLEFLFVEEGWDEHAEPSLLGVLEPPAGARAIPDSQTLILVPAMAYTPQGDRLGRGKGYYDRYLRQYPEASTIGICRSYQMQKKLPTESWDMRVREVLCNGFIYRT
ncbi:MAG: 5-formyltetrahydrofolate cyclo-ligase [Sphaerochaeta sp.]|nr:5-formyltetrahydrofolate cyclo-ligase [Sphaerochaeta sp.]